jgi:hypothetical protein
MRVLRNLLIGLTILSASCSTIRIPNSPDKAKRKIERKYNQIKAIAEYHDLATLNTVKDTVRVTVPRYFKSVEINSPSFLSRLDTAFYRYVEPSLKDGVDVQVVYRDIFKTLKPEFIDKRFEDSLSVIAVYGYPDSLKIDVLYKERDFDKPIEYEQLVVDTEVKWYEDRFIKAVFLVLVIGGVTSVILLLIRKGAY